MLHLLATFLESAPQLVLQLCIIVQTHKLQAVQGKTLPPCGHAAQGDMMDGRLMVVGEDLRVIEVTMFDTDTRYKLKTNYTQKFVFMFSFADYFSVFTEAP